MNHLIKRNALIRLLLFIFVHTFNFSLAWVTLGTWPNTTNHPGGVCKTHMDTYQANLGRASNTICGGKSTLYATPATPRWASIRNCPCIFLFFFLFFFPYLGLKTKVNMTKRASCSGTSMTMPSFVSQTMSNPINFLWLKLKPTLSKPFEA